MNLTFHYKSKDTQIDGAKTKADGTAGQTVDIGSATVGYKVIVDVAFYLDNQLLVRTVTGFTPTK